MEGGVMQRKGMGIRETREVIWGGKRKGVCDRKERGREEDWRFGSTKNIGRNRKGWIK